MVVRASPQSKLLFFGKVHPKLLNMHSFIVIEYLHCVPGHICSQRTYILVGGKAANIKYMSAEVKSCKMLRRIRDLESDGGEILDRLIKEGLIK